MNHIDGVMFKDAWKGRLSARFGDHKVHFLGLAELRTNKLAAGRAKDMADVALIEEMGPTQRGRRTVTKRAQPSGSRTTQPRKRRS